MKTLSACIVFCCYFVLLGCSLLFFCGSAAAACACTQGTGVRIIGYELIGDICPADGDTDATPHVYIQNYISCTNNKVTLESPHGDMQASPSQIEYYFTVQSPTRMRVLRNPSGTHFMAVHPSFTGTILGIKMAGKAVGVYTDEALNQYCTVTPGPDYDSNGNGIPDCFEPPPELERSRCFGPCQ